MKGVKAFAGIQSVITAARRLRMPKKGLRRSLRAVSELLNQGGYRRRDGGLIRPHNVRRMLAQG